MGPGSDCGEIDVKGIQCRHLPEVGLVGFAGPRLPKVGSQAGAHDSLPSFYTRLATLGSGQDYSDQVASSNSNRHSKSIRPCSYINSAAMAFDSSVTMAWCQ